MKNFVTAILIMTVMTITLAGCGNNQNTQTSSLPGTCEEILNRVYETAELDPELRDAMQYYETTAVSEENEEYILGTDDIDIKDSVYSAPRMSSIAYQCVLLRVSQGQNIEKAKQLLLDHADPRKWVCVEAESVIVENNGDVILYIMADTATAEAIQTAFQSLTAE